MSIRFSRRLVVAVAVATIAGGLAGAGPAISAQPDAVPAPAPGPIKYAEQPTAIPGSYIVVLKPGTPPEDTGRVATDLTNRYGGAVRFVYDANGLGFAVDTSADSASLIAGDPLVDYVAQDQEVGLDYFVQLAPPSWGIDRIDEHSLPLDNKYHYPNTAANVNAYIIDTGILLNHQEFGGRAVCGFDPFATGCAPCNQGHGTHVAGTVGGSTTGVAKGVRIVSVKVFNCAPSTTWALVIAGVNYVTLSAPLTPGPDVANMSLGGLAFAPVDAAVLNSIATANVHYSLAAGNSNANVCLFSPARVGGPGLGCPGVPAHTATTVGATTNTDNRAGFSNFGVGVDLFAPGASITSAWFTAVNAYAVLSGTSMASPHAAGTAALWRQRFPADTAVQVKNALANNATPGVVINPGAGSPNLLL
ncbi:MAG TPA: S8 family serine peptidase, partial [Micromonosporaceae bacterium]|nr:S8 family serine peptidase [Micromonosporaceae bacterium]